MLAGRYGLVALSPAAPSRPASKAQDLWIGSGRARGGRTFQNDPYDPDEVDLVSRVLTDPDRTMAQSAVLRHLDRRAASLCLGPSYEGWV